MSGMASMEDFKSRVQAWADRLRVAPNQVRVQRMTKKWASCSTKGWVSFAYDLLEMPQQFQDYVIVHELLHLKIPNHSRVFRSLLSAYVPGWERIKDGCVQVSPSAGAEVKGGSQWLISKNSENGSRATTDNEREGATS